MSVRSKQYLLAVRRLVLVLLVVMGALTVLSTPALAEESRAGWELSALTKPTYLRPGGRGALVVKVINVGAATSNGVVAVTDTLPPGVTAVQAGGFGSLGSRKVGPEERELIIEPGVWKCSGNGPGEAVAGATVVTCVNGELMPGLTGGRGTPTGPGYGYHFNPEYADPELAIDVKAPTSEGTIAEPNRVAIAGGGALSTAGTRDPITVSSKPAPFGIEHADAWFRNANGTVDTQAGSHPYEATFIFGMNTHYVEEAFPEETVSGSEERNLTVDLPPGFIGDPYAVPMCTRQQFDEGGEGREGCPAASQVGIISVEAPGEPFFSTNSVYEGAPVYNLVPPEGEPADFGFQLVGVNTQIGTYYPGRQMGYAAAYDVRG